MRFAPSAARVFAMVVAFTAHIVLIGILVRETDVRPAPYEAPQTMDIQLRDFEVVPPPPPPRPPDAQAQPKAELAAPLNPKRVQRAAIPLRSAPVPTPSNTSPATEPPSPATFDTRINHQRREVAADIARENAPKRDAFAGRSIDGMLPDGETGILPGFRPKPSDGNRDTANKILQMLGSRLPRSASDYDAPVDPLTERWEDAHHSSDMADCDRKYERFDAQLRRELCGFVRPPP